jgi:pimeloyl-ACP methyl ester carboxylesterase
MRLSARAYAAAAIVAAAVLPLLAQLSGASAAAPAPRFTPAPCQTLVPLPTGTRCGFLTVPENRAAHGSKTIDVAVAIVPAAGKRRSSVPLVYLGGGPGGAPIFQATALAAAHYNDGRDLVLVDQRGTYLSKPALTCPSIDRFNGRALGMPLDAKATRVAHVGATRECRAHLVAMGADIAAYNTAENAADFAALRRALGYGEWNVYGTSYGTSLALALLRLDPAGVRALVLDSTVPPNIVTLSGFWPNARDGLGQLFASCEAQPACRRGYPRLRERFTAAVAGAERRPVSATVNDPVTKRAVAVVTDGGALANWLVSMSFHSDMYPNVPRWIAAFASGHPQDIAAQRAAFVTPEGFVGYGLTFGVTCGEWVPFEPERRILVEARRAFPRYPASVLAEAPQFTYLSDDCRVWNVPPLPSSRVATRSDKPVLFVSGSFDAVTPLRWAKAAAATLPHARVIVIPGVGHDTVDGSTCAQQAMNAFLDDPLAPLDRCVTSLRPEAFATPKP